jgi:hypothetical protein
VKLLRELSVSLTCFPIEDNHAPFELDPQLVATALELFGDALFELPDLLIESL